MNLWHALFRIRHFEWALGRHMRIMFTWRPRWGLGFEVDTNVDPSFQIEGEEWRYPTYFNVGVTLIWVSLALIIPDDKYDDPEFEPRRCSCGAETYGLLVDACAGCGKRLLGCICEKEDLV